MKARCNMAWCVMLIFGAASLAPTASSAQAPDDSKSTCETILAKVNPEAAAASREVIAEQENPALAWCLALATNLKSDFTDHLYDAVAKENIAPRDLQSSATQGASTGGSPAQDEAVPSVQPLALAGGSLSAVGTDAGASAITTLTINPASFFVGTDARSDLATFSRLADVSFLFPVDNLDADKDGKIDYFGMRARLNVNSFSQGSKILDEATKQFREIIGREAKQVFEIGPVLNGADDVEACYEALRDGGDVVGECGSEASLDLSDTDKSAYEAFRKQLAKIREEADASYFGLDLRVDFGDPTLGEVPGASGTGMLVGLAAGKQMIGSSSTSIGFRGRLGVRYFDQDNYTDSVLVAAGASDVNPVRVEGATNYSFDGAMGFEVVRRQERQPVRFSLGLELRIGDPSDDRDEQFQTDYLLLRSSLNVPIAGSNSLSVGVAWPWWGDVSPALSINLNWDLLLPDEKP